jgi:hypothetical protein
MKWKAPLKIEVFDSEETTARAAAKFIAAEAKAAVRALRDESCP